MVVSQDVYKTSLKSSISLILFLKLTSEIYESGCGKFPYDLTEKAGDLFGFSRYLFYKSHKQWRARQEEKAIKAMKNENKIVDSDRGWFQMIQGGPYRRICLLDEEYLKNFQEMDA